MGSLHWVKGLYMGVRWQLERLETMPSEESVSPGSLRKARKALKIVWLQIQGLITE